jgi:hypothetical protein
VSAVAEPRETPDLAKLRKEFESEKLRVLQSGDTESIERLAVLEQKADDPSFWESAPSVLAQLSDHLKRLGIK